MINKTILIGTVTPKDHGTEDTLFVRIQPLNSSVTIFGEIKKFHGHNLIKTEFDESNILCIHGRIDCELPNQSNRFIIEHIIQLT